jgi:hypothetical protein
MKLILINLTLMLTDAGLPVAGLEILLEGVRR